MAGCQKTEARGGAQAVARSPTAGVAAVRPVVGPRERSTGSSAHTPVGCGSSECERAASAQTTSRSHRLQTRLRENAAATLESEPSDAAVRRSSPRGGASQCRSTCAAQHRPALREGLTTRRHRFAVDAENAKSHSSSAGTRAARRDEQCAIALRAPQLARLPTLTRDPLPMQTVWATPLARFVEPQLVLPI